MTVKEVMQLLETYTKIYPFRNAEIKHNARFKSVKLQFKEERNNVLVYHVLSGNGEIVSELEFDKNLIPIIFRVSKDWAQIELCDEEFNCYHRFEYIPTRIIENIAGRIW